METAAEKYRRIRTEQKQTLYDVPCSCGMVWKCERKSLDFWIRSGVLPAKLAGTFFKLHQSGKLNDLNLETLAPEQVVQSIEFTSKVVRFTAIEPKIVEHPKDPNDIGYDEVMQCCYNTLRDWQMKGGDEGKSLENFPQ